jgi:hypothetical protein
MMTCPTRDSAIIQAEHFRNYATGDVASYMNGSTRQAATNCVVMTGYPQVLFSPVATAPGRSTTITGASMRHAADSLHIGMDSARLRDGERGVLSVSAAALFPRGIAGRRVPRACPFQSELVDIDQIFLADVDYAVHLIQGPFDIVFIQLGRILRVRLLKLRVMRVMAVMQRIASLQ